MKVTDLENLIARIDWQAAAESLDTEGMAILQGLISPDLCKSLASRFDRDDLYRSTIDMAQYNFGQGVYRYYDYPLPDIIHKLRNELYPPLSALANEWAQRLGQEADWPATHAELIDKCRKAGQGRPTPLILRYHVGDYNCLHRDLYGEVHFPLQLVIMLSDPGTDFEGGEFVLVENRPRMQSRAYVHQLCQGDCGIFPVRDRPRQTKTGWSRSQIRHGVSPIRYGERLTLGIIFHDAE